MTEQNSYDVIPPPQLVADTEMPVTQDAAENDTTKGEGQRICIGAAVLGEVTAAEVLGEAIAVLPQSETDLGGEQSPAAILLDNMRKQHRESGQPLAKRSRPPVVYAQALEDLLDIHQSRTQPGATAAVSESAVGRLLSNVLRFRAETGLMPGDPPDLNRPFLEELYSLYTDDVVAFQQNNIPKADLTALFHSRHIVDALEQRYATHSFIGKTEIAFSFNIKRSNPQAALDALITDVHHMKNVVEPRLRAKYGFEGDWTLASVKSMVWAKEGGEKTAEKIFQTMRELLELHPRARLASVESWARGKVVPKIRKSKTIDILFSDTPNITLGKEDIAEGARQLALMREAKLAGELKGGGRGANASYAPETAKLVQIAETNWQDYFDLIDVAQEVSRLWATAKSYNELRSEGEEAKPAISMDIKNLYFILAAFAQDVAALGEEGPPGDAAQVAWFHAPGIYELYKARYADDPLISPAIVVELVRRSRGGIDSQIEQWFSRIQPLREHFEGVIGATNLQRLAQLADGLDRAKKCAALKEKTMPKRSWLADSDVEYFFVRRGNPEKDFEDWAGKVEEIAQDASCGGLSLTQRKRLAKREGDTKKVIEDYHSRVREILDEHATHPVVTPDYAARWSIDSPDHLHTANEHVERANKIDQLLLTAGVRAEATTLGHLAFKTDQLEAIVSAYLRRRRLMMEEYSGDQDVEQWMIDQVASVDTMQIDYMRPRIRALVTMKQQGAFDDSVTTSLEKGQQSAASKEPQAVDGDPKRGGPTQSATSKHLEQLSPFLHWLAPLDRRAVITVLGFADSGKEELREELGVEDLDAYVLQEVVPHLIRRMRIRNT